jgi:hypothetical protein
MNRLMCMIAVGAVLAIAIPAQDVSAQGTDPVNGTWKLNVAKSKFSSGQAPKSQTRTYQVSGDSIKNTTNGVDSEGKPVHVEFTANYDGKDYPMTGNPDANTIAIKRVDRYTAVSTLKKNGKVVARTTRKVAKDGKTATFESRGTNAKGEKIDNLLFFEKQ